MRKFSTFLIIVGILLVAYPLLDRAYSAYMQWQIEQTYTDLGEVFVSSEETGIGLDDIGTPASITTPTVTATPSELTVTTASVPVTPSAAVAPTEPPAPAEATQPPAPVDAKKPVGEIRIPKIKVKLPIMNGATYANMKVGAAWMKETTPIGQNGNTAIAAHRSYTYGRNFNRLDEMALGDEIQIISNGKEYKYIVYNIVVVEPTDVSVLRGKKSESVVTLITCTPIKVATHRLIVQGRLVQ